MPIIYWSVTGTSLPCDFITTYPKAAGDGIADQWNLSTDPRSAGSLDFGKDVWAVPLLL